MCLFNTWIQKHEGIYPWAKFDTKEPKFEHLQTHYDQLKSEQGYHQLHSKHIFCSLQQYRKLYTMDNNFLKID